MGHDLHFLQRLERVDEGQVDLAMSLYNDSEGMRWILDRAGVEGDGRLAVSLGDVREGPFVLVERNGRFVTCLARGMRPDVPVVNRAKLDSLLSRLAEHRRREGFADRYEGAAGGHYRLFKRALEAGDRLSREEFAALSFFTEWVEDAYLEGYLVALDNLETRRLDAACLSPSDGKWGQVQRELWQVVWHASRTALLGYMDAAAVLAASPPDVVQRLLGLALRTLAQTQTLFGVAAGLWIVNRHARHVVDALLEKVDGATCGGTEFIYDLYALTTIGLGHAKLRGDVERVLRRPEESVGARGAQGDQARLAFRLVRGPLSITLEQPENAVRVAMGCAVHWRGDPCEPVTLVKTPGVRWPEADEVELLTPMFHSALDPCEPSTRIVLAYALPRLARMGAEELLPTREWMRANPSRYGPDIMRALARRLAPRPRAAPAPAAPAPARNAPCPCGSGRKYKRCCAVKDER